MIPMDNLRVGTLFVDYYEKRFKDLSNVIVVSPDIVSVTICRDLAFRLGDVPMAIIDKRRETANVSEVLNINR